MVDVVTMALFIHASSYWRRTMSEYLDGKRIERLAEWQQHVRERMDELVDICLAYWVLGDVVLVRGDGGSYITGWSRPFHIAIACDTITVYVPISKCYSSIITGLYNYASCQFFHAYTPITYLLTSFAANQNCNDRSGQAHTKIEGQTCSCYWQLIRRWLWGCRSSTRTRRPRHPLVFQSFPS